MFFPAAQPLAILYSHTSSGGSKQTQTHARAPHYKTKTQDAEKRVSQVSRYALRDEQDVVQYIQDPHHPERLEIKRTSKQTSLMEATAATRMHATATATAAQVTSAQTQAGSILQRRASWSTQTATASSQRGLPLPASNRGRWKQRPFSAAPHIHGNIADGSLHARAQADQDERGEPYNDRKQDPGAGTEGDLQALTMTLGAHGGWQSKVEDIWEERFAALGGRNTRSGNWGHGSGQAPDARPWSAPNRAPRHELYDDSGHTPASSTDKVRACVRASLSANFTRKRHAFKKVSCVR